MFQEKVIFRIQRLTSCLSILAMLYRSNSLEWIQKTTFHCIELTCRTLATNVHQRIWNLVHEDLDDMGERKVSNVPDEQHLKIINEVKPSLHKLLMLAFEVLKRNSDEYICLEKVEQCLVIIDYIREEYNVRKRVL